MLPTALAGHLLLIPRLGAAGAALVTTLVAMTGAVVAVALVRRAWGIVPPAGTAVRSAAVCAGAYAAAAGWHVPIPLLPVKLLAIAATVPVALLALGEFDAAERALARSLVR
jgi:peptidoglycan biosynthesis protein MviN/MurJ (putative lipid II flippase)